MLLRSFSAKLPPDVAKSFARFESGFRHPQPAFTVRHIDYFAYVASLGDAQVFLVERDGLIVGCLGAAIRRLFGPDGGEQSAMQIVDLRVTAEGGDKAMARLAQAAHLWGYNRTHAAFSVVPEDESEAPGMYGSRAQISAFRRLARIALFSIPATKGTSFPDGNAGTPEQVEGTYLDSLLGRFVVAAGTPAERSKMAPVALMDPERTACGIVEDARAVRRLIGLDGKDLAWAHLSNFAFHSGDAAGKLVRIAMKKAAEAGAGTLNIAASEHDARVLRRELAGLGFSETPATVFGTLLMLSPDWHVSSAEVW